MGELRRRKDTESLEACQRELQHPTRLFRFSERTAISWSPGIGRNAKTAWRRDSNHGGMHLETEEPPAKIARSEDGELARHAIFLDCLYCPKVRSCRVRRIGNALEADYLGLVASRG